MRRRHPRHGLTLIELMVTSSIMTLLAGMVLLMLNTVGQGYNARMALGQLSGYLDETTYQLRRDVWGAAGTCQRLGAGPVCPNTLPGSDTWLMLQAEAAAWGVGPDVRYTLEPHPQDPTNLTLVRRQWNNGAGAWGLAWIMAHHIRQPQTQAVVAGSLIAFTFALRKGDLSGRQHDLSTNVTYRFQGS